MLVPHPKGILFLSSGNSSQTLLRLFSFGLPSSPSSPPGRPLRLRRISGHQPSRSDPALSVSYGARHTICTLQKPQIESTTTRLPDTRSTRGRGAVQSSGGRSHQSYDIARCISLKFTRVSCVAASKTSPRLSATLSKALLTAGCALGETQSSQKRCSPHSCSCCAQRLSQFCGLCNMVYILYIRWCSTWAEGPSPRPLEEAGSGGGAFGCSSALHGAS